MLNSYKVKHDYELFHDQSQKLCSEYELKQAPGRQPSTQKKSPQHTAKAPAQKQRDAHELINAKEDEISHLFLSRARASERSQHTHTACSWWMFALSLLSCCRLHGVSVYVFIWRDAFLKIVCSEIYLSGKKSNDVTKVSVKEEIPLFFWLIMSRRGAISLARRGAHRQQCVLLRIFLENVYNDERKQPPEEKNIYIECVGAVAVASLVLGNFLWLQKAHHSFLCLLKRTNYAWGYFVYT